MNRQQLDLFTNLGREPNAVEDATAASSSVDARPTPAASSRPKNTQLKKLPDDFLCHIDESAGQRERRPK